MRPNFFLGAPPLVYGLNPEPPILVVVFGVVFIFGIAVVLDATYPHQSFKSKKYLTTFKVADATSRMDNKGVCDYISIVFFADKFEDMVKWKMRWVNLLGSNK